MSRYSSQSQLVWFKAEMPEDCKDAPDEVNHGELPKNICDEVISNTSEISFKC